MKKALLLIITVIVCLSACKKDELTTKVDASYNKWVAFRNQNNNSYSYIAYGGSIFGSHIETKITVTNGKVTAREFIAGVYKPNTADLEVKETWTENATSLNTHQNSAAFYTITLDEVYVRAKSTWLKVDAKQNDIYFEAANDGMISSAGYVPKGCQDDCFDGVSIKDIKKL